VIQPTQQQPVDQAPVQDTVTASEESMRQLLRILSERRWWLLLTAVMVLSATIVFTRNQRPVYRATATLVVETAAPKVMSEEMSTTIGQSSLALRGFYVSQQHILQSREISAMVVNRLGLARDERFFGLQHSRDKLTQPQRDAIMTSADAVGMLTGRVLVETADESNILRVSIEDIDPEFARELVNGVIKAYRDRNLEAKRRIVNEASSDLTAVFKRLEGEKEGSQGELYKFEKNNDFSETRRQALKESILNLNERLAEVQTVKVRSQQEMIQLKKFRQTKDPFDGTAPALMRDGLMGELKRRFMELSGRRRELATVYLGEHPKLLAIDEQLDQLKTLAQRHSKAMYDAATQTYQSAVSEETNLLDRMEAARKEEDTVRQAKIEYDKLVAKAEEDKMFYDKVAKRIAETDITREIGLNNVQILDQAITPQIPVRPNLQLNLGIGLVFALAAGVLVAVGVDLLDATIKDRADVESVLNMPFLGAIPNYLDQAALPDEDGRPALTPDQVDLYVHHRPNSSAAEAARSVRTNLLFMRPNSPLRTLLITSAVPREGKSSTSATLAITLAAASGSAILVDTDLRKPRLHKIFGVPSGVGGVTGYLMSNEKIDKFVCKSKATGLDFLPCGAVPPNPSELLHTERFRQMVAELSELYETVIFDSPPIEIVADALVLASLCDGTIVVAHAGKSRRDAVLSAVTALRSVKATVLGVVLSRANKKGAGYGYYYAYGVRKKVAYRYRYAADPAVEAAHDARLAAQEKQQPPS
jgi:succinoglycan biosynthesis transport protein ExoP